MLTTDDDRRRTTAYPISSPGAFGSDELKYRILKTKVLKENPGQYTSNISGDVNFDLDPLMIYNVLLVKPFTASQHYQEKWRPSLNSSCSYENSSLSQ